MKFISGESGLITAIPILEVCLDCKKDYERFGGDKRFGVTIKEKGRCEHCGKEV